MCVCVCVCVCIHIYIYEQIFYISGNFPLFIMWADTDHLLKNYTAFHCNFPLVLNIPPGKPHGSIRKRPVYIKITFTKSPSLQVRNFRASLTNVMSILTQSLH